MTRIARLLSFFLFLTFATAIHAQSNNCSFLGDSPYQQLYYNPSCSGSGTYPQKSIGTVTWDCEDGNNNYAIYAGPQQTSVTGYGQIHFWPFCSGVPYECDAREYDSHTYGTDPTDYNRFYNYAFDVYYAPSQSNQCPQNGYWRQVMWQCAVVGCDSGGGGTTCTCDPNNPDPNCCGSPIILDVSGNGFLLTNAQGGVKFDIAGINNPVQIAWTAPGAQNAFLCLPDIHGQCDDGKDLFGNFTSQPASPAPNGFAALAVYDNPGHGGNGDGIIDAHDAIFSRLRLWIDANHDGISQPNELFTLPQFGIISISLDYKTDMRTDQYGNIFRYRAQVGSTNGAGRMAYDVFFLRERTTAATLKACPPRPHITLKEEKTLLR